MLLEPHSSLWFQYRLLTTTTFYKIAVFTRYTTVTYMYITSNTDTDTANINTRRALYSFKGLFVRIFRRARGFYSGEGFYIGVLRFKQTTENCEMFLSTLPSVYLTIIPRTRVGYELLDVKRGAEHRVSYH